MLVFPYPIVDCVTDPGSHAINCWHCFLCEDKLDHEQEDS